MKNLFDDVSANCSKITTSAYSTSFSMGILLLSPETRKPIRAIYGFVRFADEIVDSFSGYDQAYLLRKFKQDTAEALDQRISLNPILNSFQQAVHEFGIDRELINTFLRSMEMDLVKVDYSRVKYEEYILGSAEVVGLMCLHVFTLGDKTMFAALKPSAMRLGAAFQKINFLRDMKADYQTLGRSYFPNVNIEQFNNSAKLVIEQEIQADFSAAIEGIRQLPSSSKGGVYLAYMYYMALFKKIQEVPAERVMNERIRINNGHKLGLMFNSLLQYKMNLL